MYCVQTDMQNCQDLNAVSLFLFLHLSLCRLSRFSNKLITCGVNHTDTLAWIHIYHLGFSGGFNQSVQNINLRLYT